MLIFLCFSSCRSVVLPIIRDFDPEMILVAAGFDAAAGHPAPLGGYRISPACKLFHNISDKCFFNMKVIFLIMIYQPVKKREK